jgi:SAM-dependent methyltransferase
MTSAARPVADRRLRPGTLTAMSVVSPPARPAPHGRDRYARYWGTEFWGHVNRALASARAVLDVGGGRRPTIAVSERPGAIEYVGIDPSASELSAAPPGSYDSVVAAPAERFVPELVSRFDLIVSWQVLEHVQDMQRAADNFHAYLRPGGTCVACLSGRNAVYALANRLLPDRVAHEAVWRLRRREPDSVFPAHYDRCDDRGLAAVFSAWAELEVIPLWRGADYFERLPGLLALYLRYEDLAIDRGWDRLATHYVVAARKAGSSPG